jgi:AraC family transcriptional regulator of adaptative response / DNA-3-methyladenine glycosylase II
LEAVVDPRATVAQLHALPGIGPWTAEYIAMRALRWPDAFPASDLGIRKALGMQSTRAVTKLAESWRPWRAYAAMLLWQSTTFQPDKQKINRQGAKNAKEGEVRLGV